MEATMKVQEFFDPATFTLAYVVFDEASRDAVVIDPVLDFDPLAAETGTASLEKVASFAKQSALRVHCILEKHAHANHITGAQPPAQDRDDARRVRALPQGARRDAEGTSSALSERAAERERGEVAAAPRERSPLPDDSTQPVETWLGRTVKETSHDAR
jgi:glyoxylase-like metal-dependent hydrolase (beta-lactamase superfamily II)